jgi:predicted ArsR family transcriptional regulator
LNRHLHALADLGIVETKRITGKGRPQTIVRITREGRDRFLDYIDALEAIVRDVQRSRKRKASPARTVPASSTSQ